MTRVKGANKIQSFVRNKRRRQQAERRRGEERGDEVFILMLFVMIAFGLKSFCC